MTPSWSRDGVGDVVHRQRHVAEQLLADAEAPRPRVGHLAVGAVDARVGLNAVPATTCVAQLVQRRLGGGRQPRDAGIAGRVGDHVGHEHDWRQRMGRVDRDAREQRLDAALLERQVVHHRHVGEELADAAAHHGAAVAADVPGEAGARRERVVVVGRLLVVVPAQAQVQRHVVGEAPLVLEEEVPALVLRHDGVAVVVRRTDERRRTGTDG